VRAGALLRTLIVTVAGTGCAGASWWGLLNVPESNMAALGVSALLLVATVLLVGYTIAAALATSTGDPIRRAAALGIRGLPGFTLGAIVFCGLWWVTSTIDTLWSLHRGETDAMFLRYAGTANTAWMHTAVSWLMWLIQWGVGLSIVVGATAGSLDPARFHGGPWTRLGSGLTPTRVGATILALLVGHAVWSLAYWRPAALPANTTELIFVAAKLGAIGVIAALLIALVLQAFVRPSAASR
jgi:hypothetical protein